MSEDSYKLPPCRRAADDVSFGEPTPETKPEMNAVSPDDPAVAALTTPPPAPDALPPPPDQGDGITPPPFDPGDPMIVARKERQRPIANAELLRAFVDQHPDDDDIPSLRLRVLHLETRLEDLEAFVRNEFKRRHGG